MLAINTADLLEAPRERIDIEQGLRRVLIRSGSGIDDRQFTICVRHHPGDALCETAHRMPHDNQVGIGAEGPECILRRFPFHFA